MAIDSVAQELQIRVGTYINFRVRKVKKTAQGYDYTIRKLTGRVISIDDFSNNQTNYRVKVFGKAEFHEVSFFRIDHIWYVV